MCNMIIVASTPTSCTIRRKSPRTGKFNNMEIPVPVKRIEAWYSSCQVIQQALPELTPDQREFLLSGYTPEDWEIIFPPGEDDDLDHNESEEAF